MGANEKLVPRELLKTYPGLKIRAKQNLTKKQQATEDCLNKNINEERAHV